VLFIDCIGICYFISHDIFEPISGSNEKVYHHPVNSEFEGQGLIETESEHSTYEDS